MRDHYGLAQRTSDDGTLMYAPIHPAIPKLSLWRLQVEAPEQELGQPSRGRGPPIAAIAAIPRCTAHRPRRRLTNDWENDWSRRPDLSKTSELST